MTQYLQNNLQVSYKYLKSGNSALLKPGQMENQTKRDENQVFLRVNLVMTVAAGNAK